ncbi:MAG TPA: hypothetical protein VM871_10140 [Flavisolibacter sp.]|nr:hypothetical protein [Flavisolibacter sp.]
MRIRIKVNGEKTTLPQTEWSLAVLTAGTPRRLQILDSTTSALPAN